jgi:hypothetical protein
MSGVHQIKKQNERILTLMGERPSVERPAEESAITDTDTREGEEPENAHSD